jgi:type VI secretion system lysozyme-like protein
MESRHQRHHLEGRPTLVAGLAVPLFDRFIEDLDDSRIVEPYRIQDLPLLLESIQKEIGNLLNTRVPPRRPPAISWEPVSEPQTVLDFGLPAFSALSAGSLVDIKLLSDAVIAKIAAFEPRLESPELELRSDPENPAAMIGQLRGCVRLGKVTQPVCFPVSLRNHGEDATIASAETTG